MCGFTSIIHFNSTRLHDYETEIKLMNETIVHRGPNSEGYFSNQAVHFGFRRLSILDINGGSQPMSFDNGKYTIIFNGEIYNEDKYREQLEAEGVLFNTTTDTEVILALYKKYKYQTAEKLRGMFAFMIWDNEEGSVYGARDHFGIKPMYYREAKGTFYFASENKALEAVMSKRELCHESLQHYLTFQYVLGENCLTKGIHSVNPGTQFTITADKGLVFERYYNPTFKPVNIEEQVLANQITDALYESVQSHMRADVTVGSFLSGGVDSSIIVSLANQMTDDLETFSVGFEREGYSEIEVAKETADKLGVKNFSRIITPQDFMNEFDDYVWYMDDPLADPAAVAQYFLAQEAAKRCTVSLSGEGADELFGGYLIYHEPISLAGFDKFSPGMKKVIRSVAKKMPKNMKGRGFLLRGSTPLEERFVGNANIYKEEEKREFLKTFKEGQSYMDLTGPLYAETTNLDATTRMQDIDMHTWLVDDLLHNADRTTMASSLELRTPFVDKEVFKVAAQIPTELKFKNGTSKYLLRKAAESFVPEHVLYREKLGFPVPIRFWLKDELYQWAHQIFSDSKATHIIDKDYTLNMLEAHRKGQDDYSRKIWTLLTFIRWYELHLLN
ncbi:asparagine synthase (glutamine-hydrolyzing) [Vagococcus xieshaowenii]|uniref:asparagine synthase (glutamine-hydrolyzing) n=1 Tax=Vagococcus xieshaowenii TaxID=2562451 RepID=A0AAJ5EFF3_9ENTE|nr:asparagine synthase (glutamine-hydrolyzing) [Vagococcus xieshaowenii]QCA28449.1 asparagine synthase (glutamine-hydrolyzing) [Vagococcus xieshaowenii]TFZ42795.1 asparagine synthase (glutamine-hydrolyzing) [Vagococcus xieshaowenii]